MKNNLLKLALSAMTLLPMGAWAIDFGTEQVVSTTTVWTFNTMTDVVNTASYLADDQGNGNLYANCKSGSNSTTRTFTPTALGDTQKFAFGDGYTVAISKVLVVNANLRNPNNLPEGTTAETITGDYGQGFLAFNATVAGTLYVYMNVTDASASAADKGLRIYHSENVADSKIKSSKNSTATGLQEISYTSAAAGTFFIGITAGGGGKIYAARFVPTSEKKDEWVYIGETGFATYANNNSYDIPELPTGLSAYAATAGTDGHSVVLSTRTGIRRTNGYILKGTPNTNYGLTLSGTALGPEFNGGDLKRAATYSSASYVIPATDSGKYNYLLGNDNGTAKFFAPNGTSALNSKKAFLQVSSKLTPATAARGIDIVFADDVTGISATLNDKGEMTNDSYFNLAGQRVAQPTRGLYIVNGKKYIVK
jgi:hypothetical protein